MVTKRHFWFRFSRGLVDLLLIAVATLVARAIGLNFDLAWDRFVVIGNYIWITVVSTIFVIVVLGLNQSIWRLSALGDYIKVVQTIVVTVILAMLVDFLYERLNDIPRSLPILQVVVAIILMIGVRVTFRLMHQARRMRQDGGASDYILRPGVETVLIFGVNRVTELYAQLLREVSFGRTELGGIIANEPHYAGHSFGNLKVLGSIDQLNPVLSELEVHGVFVDRLVVTVPFADLTDDRREIFRQIEESGVLRVDYLYEMLKQFHLAEAEHRAVMTHDSAIGAAGITLRKLKEIRQRPYWTIKRLIDIVGSASLIVVLAPIIVLVAFLVTFDVGLPITFWQRRPGRNGRSIRVIKFRTMRAAHDDTGERLEDAARTSVIGHLLRRTRLDELPQLFQILTGEMSFIGPRPLLPVDQPSGESVRLAVRPGLTGWAQVHGGRVISADDKALLDEWYVLNASLAVDLEIVLRTIPMVLFGERYNIDVIERARRELRGNAQPPGVTT